MRYEVLTGWKENKELNSAIKCNDVEYPLYREFLNELKELAIDFADDTITVEQIKDWFDLRANRVTVTRRDINGTTLHDELMFCLEGVKADLISIVLPRTQVKVKNEHNAIRWNVPDENNQPLLTANCTDHPAVHRVSYETVSSVLQTSGCSPEEPYWIHSVLGSIQTKRGIQIVCPGDWIVEPTEGVYLVITHDQYLDYLALFNGTKAQAS